MKNIIFIFILSLPLFAPAKGGIQYISSTSGFTYFSGSIIMPACHVVLDNPYQYIDMGKVKNYKLSLTGETTPPTKFRFNLDSCDDYIADHLIIAINDSNSVNNEIISIEDGEGYAKNVAIMLYNNTTPIIVNKKFKPTITIDEFGKFIPFRTRYKLVGSVFKDGKIDAAVNLSIYYP